MGLEHRAENPSLPQAAIRPAVLPRELRVSVFAARLFLAALGTLGVATQPVYAAGVDCKNSQLLVVGVGYVDNPLVPNISGKADPADIVVGSLKEFGVAVIERSDNPSDSNSKKTEIARGNLINRGAYSSQVFVLNGLSNTKASDGSAAMQVGYYFDSDPAQKNLQTGQVEKPRLDVVVKCGFTVPTWAGRTAPLTEIEKILDGRQLLTVASVTNQEMLRVTKRSAGLGPDTVMQEETVRALRAYIDRAKAAASVATKTPEATVPLTQTASRTPTPTPFPAGTPISLDEARARLTATANAAPTPTPTKGPDYMATAQVEVGKKQEGWFNLGLPRDIDRLIVGGSIVGELSVLGVLLFLVRYRIAKYRYKKAVAAGGAGAPAAWHRPSLWKVWQW